jgi:hypothetical protein
MKGGYDGDEKNDGWMKQNLSWLQYWTQISLFIYRQESEGSLGKRLHYA